jgi:hypothetical protein
MKQLFVVTETRGLAWDASKLMNQQEQWTEHAAFTCRANRAKADESIGS